MMAAPDRQKRTRSRPGTGRASGGRVSPPPSGPPEGAEPDTQAELAALHRRTLAALTRAERGGRDAGRRLALIAPLARAAQAGLELRAKLRGELTPAAVTVNVMTVPGVQDLTRAVSAFVLALLEAIAPEQARRGGELYRAWLEAAALAPDSVAALDPRAWLEARLASEKGAAP